MYPNFYQSDMQQCVVQPLPAGEQGTASYTPLKRGAANKQ